MECNTAAHAVKKEANLLMMLGMDLEALQASIESSEKNLAIKYNLRDIIKERLENKTNPLFDKINIVSLGENCEGRTIPARYGIIKMRDEGRLSMPFDLAVHHGKSIIKILENNFDGYLDKENLHFTYGKNDIWKCSLYPVSFNHDKDLTENDKEKLIERYKKRIDNFINTVKNSKKTFYIYSIFCSDFKDFGRMKKLLNRYSDNCHLIVLNHRNILLDIKDPLITIIDSPFPSEEYNWHLPSCYLSDEGIAFERTNHFIN
ncbi:MAG: DUF1796 family putative cysteine peptidase [Sulfuricurvum sp.]|uniref:DUF1796 family putative cysteine peptidase n=1 Tax=Sulfuricurvum sp. TaxID=2025608 RepID=UPI0026093E1D|nr:DUF1796 family putative cysteine peptidase [Sulfuricurvum sp.]MDD2828449.1 DUF1796 family putative cysteine peptidase [Sulfuricurvum sp.]MDD4949454.1 DUF1796 family putative cysteine peptidase [Sulfuricurvum sp.]